MTRDLGLNERIENVREQRHVATPVHFDLEQIKKHFDESLESIKKQYLISDQLAMEGKSDESKNILRSQIVFAEGILDFYIHEMSKYALYRMFTGEWPHSAKYANLFVPMEQVEKAIQSVESKEWFFEFLNQRFARDVFLSAEVMKDQLNLIGIPFVDVMKRAFPMGKESESVTKGKGVVENLFARRNAIAHQIDRSHASAEQNDITKEYVENRLDEIQKIVGAIQEMAKEKG